jgi:hypothetical protein
MWEHETKEDNWNNTWNIGIKNKNNNMMFRMACMKHMGKKITITYNYVIRWMKIILHESISLKWMELINDFMLFVYKFYITVDHHDGYPSKQVMCSMNFHTW